VPSSGVNPNPLVAGSQATSWLPITVHPVIAVEPVARDSPPPPAFETNVPFSKLPLVIAFAMHADARSTAEKVIVQMRFNVFLLD
jgi:hypothetical protein